MKAKPILSATTVYSITHCFVDMGCAMTIYSLAGEWLGAKAILITVLLYDFLAFVLQAPFGMILDHLLVRKGRNRCGLMSGIGCLLVAAGALLAILPAPEAVLAGAAHTAGMTAGNAVGANAAGIAASAAGASLPIASEGLAAGAAAASGAFQLADLSLPFAIFVTVLAGIGNAFFHIGGGVDILNLADRRASLPGIFVSTGAFGLYLGTKAGGMGYENLPLMALVLLLLAALVFAFYAKSGRRIAHAEKELSGAPENNIPTNIVSPISLKNDITPAGAAAHIPRKDAGISELVPYSARLRMELTAIILLALVIGYRSCLGFLMKYTWRTTFLLGLAATVCIVLGKIAGGLIGDRAGWKRTMLISMLFCAGCSIFSENSAPFGLLTLFLFNMTMPITMMALSNLMERDKGLAFGINTSALFLGLMISWLFGGSGRPAWVICIEILISTLVLFWALTLYERREGLLFTTKKEDPGP